MIEMKIDNITRSFPCYLTNNKLFMEIVIIIYNETTIGSNIERTTKIYCKIIRNNVQPLQ